MEGLEKGTFFKLGGHGEENLSIGRSCLSFLMASKWRPWKYEKLKRSWVDVSLNSHRNYYPTKLIMDGSEFSNSSSVHLPFVNFLTKRPFCLIPSLHSSLSSFLLENKKHRRAGNTFSCTPRITGTSQF
jgi:hypothetical protein